MEVAMKPVSLFVTVLMLLGLSCGRHEPLPAAKDTTQEFGFRLFHQLVPDSASENVVISPVSVQLCLAMALNGAGGATKTEIAQVLGLSGMTVDEVNRRYAGLTQALVTTGGGANLSIANSVWGSKKLTFTKAFAGTCSRRYRADVRTVDFNSPAASVDMNKWGAKKTHGLIPTVVGRVDPRTTAFLLNAVCFHGRWAVDFDAKHTRPRPFYRMDGSGVTRLIMQRAGRLAGLQTDNFSAVALPLKNPRFSMYVFVPRDHNGLPGFLGKLSDSSWSRWISEFEEVDEMLVGLPRFSIQYTTGLKRSLTAEDMVTAFSPKSADFTPMFEKTSLPVWLDDVTHSVFIEVNEKGVKAAAVCRIASIGGGPPCVFADHPFFFAIRDNKTGALLFMGAVYDPPQ
jgi:serpin B